MLTACVCPQGAVVSLMWMHMDRGEGIQKL